MAHPLLPKVLAMLVGQYIHQDPRTGLHSIYGIFDNIAVHNFPVPHALAVFIQLTNLRSPTPMCLKLVDSDQARSPLFEQNLSTPGFDPLFVFNITYQGSVLVESPGSYLLQLFAGQELLFERILQVQALGQYHLQS